MIPFAVQSVGKNGLPRKKMEILMRNESGRKAGCISKGT